MLPSIAPAELVKGVVSYTEPECSSLVIRTSMGYTVATTYTAMVLKGETVIGQLHMYGMTDLYSARRDTDAGTVYVDEYFLTVDQAVRSLRDKGCR